MSNFIAFTQPHMALKFWPRMNLMETLSVKKVDRKWNNFKYFIFYSNYWRVTNISTGVKWNPSVRFEYFSFNSDDFWTLSIPRSYKPLPFICILRVKLMSDWNPILKWFILYDQLPFYLKLFYLMFKLHMVTDIKVSLENLGGEGNIA